MWPRAISSHSDIRQALENSNDQPPLKLSVVRNQANGQTETVEVDLKVNGNLRKFASTELLAIGPTASIRDLKSVTDRDQIRVDIYVLLGVFLILVVLLRRPAICVYLPPTT